MDSAQTRTTLHGIAELLLAGPQYAPRGRVRLSGTHALAVRAATLRVFAPQQEPVLSPEHLDVAIATGEVNDGEGAAGVATDPATGRTARDRLPPGPDAPPTS